MAEIATADSARTIDWEKRPDLILGELKSVAYL